MKINIGDLLMLGCNNGHPTKAGIVTSIRTIGAISDGMLKDEDYVYLNNEETPWQVAEIKDKLFARMINLEVLKTFNINY